MSTTGKTDLQEEWRRLAPAWIRESREGVNATRAGLLDRPMIEACGDVRGLKVLDCGCGEGRFCRMLLESRGEAGSGHRPLPADDSCRCATRDKRDSYVLADVQDMGFLRGASFDLAVSYLNQCDLPDFEANTREVFRVLKPGGRFILANLHPMRSAAGGWWRTKDGDKLHAILDCYFEEGERRWKMMGIDFTNFHRALSTYLRVYRDTGFVIEGIVEPTVEPEDLRRFPQLDDEMRVPNFMVVALDKSANL